MCSKTFDSIKILDSHKRLEQSELIHSKPSAGVADSGNNDDNNYDNNVKLSCSTVLSFIQLFIFSKPKPRFILSSRYQKI